MLVNICLSYTVQNYWIINSQSSLVPSSYSMQFLAVLILYVALTFWVYFFSLQIVYVWLKNQTTKNIPSTALFLISLAAKQNVYLDIVGKRKSLWQETFWSVLDILQKKKLQGDARSVLSLSSNNCLLSNTDSPWITQFQVTQCQIYAVLRKKRNERMTFFKLLQTKRNLLYVRNQFVLRSKRFPPRL